ncbi:hypothetical protein GIB67_012779 [Kingdonia uniflora]|uniref:Condensation domain-containing protein n=1 Tax=Kingdonia uniflora TaxID=39325 RepID=A0A7J7NFW8_9MAGN|nr:hypothetical protein GIB67_012779 [Kingdonia uniflora]
MSRLVGNTEYSWCRAVEGGTGITVVFVLLSKPPNFTILQNALHNLQISHPILRSKLTFSTESNSFSFTIPQTPHLQINQSPNLNLNPNLSFHQVLEHELNQNPWVNSNCGEDCWDVFVVTVYELGESKWGISLRFHTAVCDRTSAVTVLRELLGLIGGEGVGVGEGEEGVVNLGIEDLIPSGKANKPFWARGIDLFGYSLNSFRFSNLGFCDVSSPRASGVARLQLDADETTRLLAVTVEGVVGFDLEEWWRRRQRRGFQIRGFVRELLGLIWKSGGGEGKEGVVNLGIENLIPSGKANKPFWARGVDLFGYSLNSFRFSNSGFCDVSSPRASGVVRLQLDVDETTWLLAGCNRSGVKLCGALAAAGLIAAYTSKHDVDHQSEKYAVVTIIDCRKVLDPPLQNHNLGFYHSAVLNTNNIDGRTGLWELASRCYMSFANAIDSNKHFTDMGDLNFLMCKAIDNPSFTPSSSSRTSYISVFEDPVMDDFKSEALLEVGLEDYVGCSSVHGIGPSIAVFDTIKDGRLDCAFVYPTPLHSREQIGDLIDHMKRILVEGSL